MNEMMLNDVANLLILVHLAPPRSPRPPPFLHPIHAPLFSFRLITEEASRAISITFSEGTPQRRGSTLKRTKTPYPKKTNPWREKNSKRMSARWTGVKDDDDDEDDDEEEEGNGHRVSDRGYDDE